MTNPELTQWLEDNDYESIHDYLCCLSEDYNVPLHVVKHLYDFYGDSEIADGLVSALECYDYDD